MKKLYLVVFIYFLAICNCITCVADVFTDRDVLIYKMPVIVGSEFYSYPFDYDLPQWDFGVSSIPSNYSLGAIVCTTHTGSNGGMRVEFIYTNATFLTGDSNYVYFSGHSVDGNNDYTISRSVSSGYSWSVSSGSGGSTYTKTSFSRSNVKSALWTNLPIRLNDGTVLEPSSSNPFTLRSISTSNKQSLLEVLYNGSSSDSYSVGFYACSADDYSTWWGSSVADLASQSFSELPSLGDDGSSPWYNNIFPPFKRTTRITPTNNSLSRKNSIQTLPSPRVVIGYDSVSQIFPAQAVVCWQDWINNSSMGGVYSATDIVIIARIAYTHPDLITGGTITDYYFCSQQFDISSIISAAFTPDEMNTKTQPYVAPSDVNDLDQLATYIRYLEVNNNTNANIRYNNFIQHLDESAPLYVLQGLNAFLPSLSFELDSLFDSFSIDLSVPSPADISSLQNEINLSQAAFIEKFAWTSVITSEVDFVTSTVVAAGDSPPVFSANVVYNSPSSGQQLDYGNVVFFYATDISPALRTKVKKVITVFCSLGLLFFIYKTLPATIGRIPEK